MAFLILGLEPVLALAILAVIGSGLVYYARARNGKPANTTLQRAGFVLLFASFGVSIPLLYSAFKGMSRTANANVANAANNATNAVPIVPTSAILQPSPSPSPQLSQLPQLPQMVPMTTTTMVPAYAPPSLSPSLSPSPSPSPSLSSPAYAQPGTPTMIPTSVTSPTMLMQPR